MGNLFDQVPPPPLAEALRPITIHEVIGQTHLLAQGKPLNLAFASGKPHSMILWGPPGVGKTTLARLSAKAFDREFIAISAVLAGVKEIREAIEQAQQSMSQYGRQTILFVDEIHRFNKSQQDALLPHVESGLFTFIGATTENPSFEVNSALLSRCQVYVLKPLDETALIELLNHAIATDEILSTKKIELKETAALIKISGGDARKLLNLLELVTETIGDQICITDEMVMQIAQQRISIYDKSGEQHYDIISALIKSIRGSDPNGAVYWLARMIEGGEDVKFIARRLLILASEDIGNANPNALLLANATFDAVNKIGYPESRIILSQCVTYLASSAKSNASYMAINDALSAVQKLGDLQVPLPIRNAPTQLMKKLNYGKDYTYSHNYENNFTPQEYLPDELTGTTFYKPGNNPREQELQKHLKTLWKDKYGY